MLESNEFIERIRCRHFRSGFTGPSATGKLDGVELKFWAAQTSNKIPETVAKNFEKATGAKVTIETIPDNYEQNVQTKRHHR